MSKLFSPLTLTLIGPLVALFLTACASEQYRYIPTNQAAIAQSDPRYAAYASGEEVYSVPPQAPEGQIHVLSQGIVTLKPGPAYGKEKQPPLKALHLRMVFSNQSPNQTWVLHGPEMAISFPNAGLSQPIFVNSDIDSNPDLTVNPHELRVWDLYFPLPEKEQDASSIAAFDFHWQIQAGAVTVAETTAFERTPVPTDSATTADSPYGPYAPYAPYVYDPYGPTVALGFGFGWGGFGWEGRGGGPGRRYWVRR